MLLLWDKKCESISEISNVYVQVCQVRSEVVYAHHCLSERECRPVPAQMVKIVWHATNTQACDASNRSRFQDYSVGECKTPLRYVLIQPMYQSGFKNLKSRLFVQL